MKIYSTLLTLLITVISFSQNPAGFDKMCYDHISRSIPLATPKQLNRIETIQTITILDAREPKEFEVSHIKNAINVGYDNFKIESVKNIDKTKPVYVYCSIGYRSEKIGEQLKKEGFKTVYNLYGGIFNWANTGFELIDNNNKPTTKVHGYNNSWGKWLNEEKCNKVID